jgi:DNA helicase-2/ATP-dependent DNA helicase PcrA
MSQPSRFLKDIDLKYMDMPVEQNNRQKNRDYDDYDWDSEFENKSKYTNGTTKTFTGNANTTARKPTALIPKKVVPARPPDPDFKPDNPDQIQAGMKVEHATFGIGKILQIEGTSPNRKATVFFQDTNEEKQLLLKFAKLRIV